MDNVTDALQVLKIAWLGYKAKEKTLWSSIVEVDKVQYVAYSANPRLEPIQRLLVRLGYYNDILASSQNNF